MITEPVPPPPFQFTLPCANRTAICELAQESDRMGEKTHAIRFHCRKKEGTYAFFLPNLMRVQPYKHMAELALLRDRNSVNRGLHSTQHTTSYTTE